MRVVLDSNILFSALITPKGTSGAIHRAWRAGRFQVVTSLAQLDEVRRASRYAKLRSVLRPAKVGAMINHLQQAVVLERLQLAAEADDPDDAFLLAMAVDGAADYLVTGDRQAGMLQRRRIGRARIVTPAEFRDEVLLFVQICKRIFQMSLLSRSRSRASASKGVQCAHQLRSIGTAKANDQAIQRNPERVGGVRATCRGAAIFVG